MKCTASVGHAPKFVDLRTRCRRLDLRAETDAEAEALSMILRVLGSGGMLAIFPKGAEPFSIEYPEPTK